MADANYFDQFDEEPQSSAQAQPKESNFFDQYDHDQDWHGHIAAFGKGVAQGAITGAGQAISGVPEVFQPTGEAPTDADLAASIAGTPGGEAAIGASGARPASPLDTVAGQAGKAVQDFGKRVVPMSKAEQESIAGRGGLSTGAMAPGMAAGVIGGLGAATSVFGLQGAAEQGEAAREKGATPEVAQRAAEAGFALNAAGGIIPFHAILKPIERTAPGIMNWATTRLKQAVQAGATFAGAGEAQEWLGQQIAQNFYDPNAGYSFDIQRVLGSLLSGGFLSQLRRTPYRGPSSEAAGQPAPAEAPAAETPAAETPAAKPGEPTPTEALTNILGESAPPPPAAPESESILPPTRARGPIEPTDRPQDIVNPVDPNATPQEKVKQLQALTAENKPLVDNFIKDIDDEFGTKSNSNEKTPENIIAKAVRPSIVARKPWYDVDHIRDSFRFKTVIPDLRMLPDIVSRLEPAGFQIVKRDVTKTVEPMEWGWRIASFDLRAPNGQLIEYYLPVQELEAAKKAEGHKIFEKWRNVPFESMTPEQRNDRAKDIQRSKDLYQNAWDASLKRLGIQESDLRASLNAVSTAPLSATGVQSSAISPEVIPGAARQEPPTRMAANLSPVSNTYRTEGSSRETYAPTGQVSGAEFARSINKNIGADGTINKAVPGIQPHRVTAADGTAIDVAPVVVEASDLRTSQDAGYDASLQPRQRERAASQAQVRDIASNLDPERLGYSAEADRGAPIVGPDGMVESGNGRILALRSVYEKGGKAADAYRDWLTRQGVDVAQYRNPVLVRLRATPFTTEQRRDFTVAANQAATLAMSAPERALSDAGHVDSAMLGLIHNPDDLASPSNRQFMRRFVASLPQAEQGTMADAKGALSAEGLLRVRNAILAKAYGDAATLSRIAESTNDEVKSISSALVAAAPQWAKFRAEVDAGRVRPDMDVTPDLIEAVNRTADIRGRGEKLDEYLAQQDAFDRISDTVDGIMRAFYDPRGRTAAGAPRIAKALRFYAEEASKVSAEQGLDLKLTPIEPSEVQRLAREKEWEDVENRPEEFPDRRGPGHGAGVAPAGEFGRGPGTREGGELPSQRSPLGFEEEAIRAQQPTAEELRGFVDPYKPVRTFPGEEGTEARIYPNSDGKRFNVTLYDRDSGQSLSAITIHPTLEAAEKKARSIVEKGARGEWYDKELTQEGRRQVLAAAKIGASALTKWQHLREDVQRQLLDWRNRNEPKTNALKDYYAGTVGQSVIEDYEKGRVKVVKAGAPTEIVPLAGGKKGEQYVIPGAEKISTAELLRRRAAEPMRPTIAQGIPGGLFGDLLGQEELFAPGKRLRQQQVSPAAPELAQVGARGAEPPALSGEPQRVAQPETNVGRAEGLTPRETVPSSATDLFGEAPSARGNRPASAEVRGRTPQVAGKQQPRVPTPAQRPNQLSLFGGEPSSGTLGAPDVPVQPQPRTPEVGGAGPSESVTKPPARGRGSDTGRTDNGTAPPRRAGIREAEQKIAERSRSNYRITPEDQIGVGGPKQKVHQNIAAIKLLKQLEDEGRDATPGEKAILVKYTGWGAFAQQMFDTLRGGHEAWQGERDQLRALLTDEEYNAAKHSVTNAHFTSPDVIRGMWDALGHLGYEGGSAIEPAAGVGHFIGLVPDAVAPRTAWTAVELDPVSARLTKALYGGTEVNAHGFEELKRPSNYYDLAISNVPFSEVAISEKPYGSFPLHDFFFVKSLDKVRPGGVVAFITSKGTMDKPDTRARRLLAKDADLVGAIRLPGGDKGAFAKNAGTEVTTDIVFLRKKIPGEHLSLSPKWENTKVVETPEGPTKINEYFADRPKMMLGEMRLLGSMYRADEPVLIGDAEGLQQKIADAARNMQAGAMAPRIEKPTLENLPAIETEGIKDGGFFLKDGKMYRREAGEGVPHEMSADNHDRVTRFMGMRDLYDKILDAQLNGTDAEPFREKLRAAYDAFVKKYGPINKETQTVTSRLNSKGEPVVITRQPNFSAFRGDPDAWKVASIENYDAEKGTAKAADIQTKDILRAPVEREINGPSDALAAALNDTGRVDLDHVANSLGLESIDEAAGSLGDLIYHDPNGRQWKTADDYLSGNVVQKLDEARAIAQSEPLYLRNVAALEKVQPQPIPPGADITTQFGAPWVPADVYSDFIKEVLGAGRVEIGMVPTTGQWKVEADRFAFDARNKFGTNHRGARIEDVLEAALNNRKLTVRGEKDAEGNRPILPQATEDANNKVALLREAFSGDPEFGIDGWVWQDPDRGQRLAGIFNRTYNNLAPLNVDGSHLTFPGLNPKFSDRQHRKDAVWRIIQYGNTLLAHEVGSGKTVTMIAAGMEQKRLGLIQKPAYVVPNHMLEQFSREFIEAYPDARILVASKDEMSADQRKAFIAKTAANDWDGVVITHDAFGRINVNDKFRRAHVQEQIDQYENMIAEEAASAGEKAPTVKALEKAKDKLTEKLNKLMAAESKDEGLNFEHTGIDQLFVDEAHLFKNLSFPTRMAQVKGLGQGDAQRAEDLFLKIRYLEQSKPGRSAVFATGTPVSNTMAEMWTMQRYLQLDKLRERGLENFDKWANTFGKTVTRRELGADGRTLEDVTSFSEFVNIPELVSLYAEIADTKTAEMLKLPRPDVKTRSGAPGIEVVQAEPSDAEEKAIQKLVAEAQEMKAHPKRPEKGDRIMLNVVTDGRKVATDGRLLDKDADFNPRGKVALAVDNISRIYQEGNKDPNAPNKVQMVFLDMGVPGSEKGFNLYADIKKRLVDKGVPANEIASIHDADNDVKKARLFNDTRSGKVRVIMGSTGKMGMGTNVQKRLIAMHHIDAPWKPAEVTQRDGRIVRQGNMNDAVQIYRYVTKHSFDAFMWQKLERKARFLTQILSGTKGSRTAEDVDSPLPEASEMKAAASGDPRIIEHAELDRTVRALASQRRTFESTQARANQEIASAKSRIEQYDRAIPNARDDAAMVNDTAGDKFSVDLGDKGILSERKAAGQAILDGLLKLDPKGFYRPAVVHMGKLSGFDMNMEVRSGWDGVGTSIRATPSLKGKSGYGAANDIVINEHTDPVGLMTRYEKILRSVKDNPERLEGLLKTERTNVERFEKALGEKWPKEKEYKEALAKLSELGDALKAPKSPDVIHAEEEVKAQAPPPEKIVAPAIEATDGKTYTGAMHADAAEEARKSNADVYSEGFITSTGRYVSRAEALKIARKNDQVERTYQGQNTLGSEDLKPWGDHEIDRFLQVMDEVKARGPKSQTTAAAPQSGEREVRLGPDAAAYVPEKFTKAEQKIADAVKAVVDRMAPKAEVMGARALRLKGEPKWGLSVRNPQFPNLIAWSLEGPSGGRPIATARHEIIHNLHDSGLIRPNEWAALEKGAKDGDWIGKYEIEDRYPGASDALKTEEAVAEHFAKWRGERGIEKPGLIRDAFNRLDLFFKRVAAAARQFLGANATADDVFTRIETGEVGRRATQEGGETAKAQTPAPPAAPGGPSQPLGQAASAGEKFRNAATRLKDWLNLDPAVLAFQRHTSPMTMHTSTPEARAVVKEFMISGRQAMQRWTAAAKYLEKTFTPKQLEKMWNAADEESVALQQGRPTQGIGLDRLTPQERDATQFMQRVSENLFAKARDLGMVEGPGLPSYAPRILMRMAESGKFERGIGPEAKIVRDIRTLAYANMKLERAIAARELINQIRAIGERTGNQTVSIGNRPSRYKQGADGLISHAIDLSMGKDFSTTTPQLKHRKYLTAEETEAAAQRAPALDKNAPKWFTLEHPAFQIFRPDMVDPEGPIFRGEVKRVSGMTVPQRGEVRRDQYGDIVWKETPIYVRDDFEGPLRAALEQDWGQGVQRALMSFKSKVMSVIMFSPLIHNQVEWGRAIPAAPGKVLTFQVYIEGNAVRNNPDMMREAVKGGLVPIGGHGFMQDLSSVAEGPNLEPGSKSWVTQGVGYGAKMLGNLTKIYDPQAGSMEVKRALDKAGNFWHNTLLWDRVADLQMGLWKLIREDMIHKGHNPDTANVVAAHFANRYAGALPVESMSGAARGIANLLLFSRSFTLGNVATYKDAVLGLPKDAQALIQQRLGPEELQKAQSFTKKKSRAMLAIDAGLYYTTLSLLQSAFHVAGAATSMSTLGGALAGSAIGRHYFGRAGGLAGTVIGGAAGAGAAQLLGAQGGTRTVQEEVDAYWDRFSRLLTRVREHPFQVMFNPLGAATGLLSTAENEPGLEGRLFWGYDNEGKAQYMRLPAGKVTEELLDWFGSPNDILHRKLSTFARPVNDVWSNDIGFGRKLYDPHADTPVERAQAIMKVAGMLVFSQMPVDFLRSIKDTITGPEKGEAAAKAIGQITGFTFRGGHPEGPAAGYAAYAKEKHEFAMQEAKAGIRDMIRKGDTEGAEAAMAKVNMPAGLQKWYLAHFAPGAPAQMSRKQIKEFMGFATDEQADEFARREEREEEDRRRLEDRKRGPTLEAGHASGGAVASAEPEALGPETQGEKIQGSIDDIERQQRNNPDMLHMYFPEEQGRRVTPGESITWPPWKAGAKRVADGGSVDPDYDMAAAVAAGVQPDERGHFPDTYKLPSHMTFSDESVYHNDENQGGHWDHVQGDEWNFTPGPANLQHHSIKEMQDYFRQYEPKSHLILPAQRARGGRIVPKGLTAEWSGMPMNRWGVFDKSGTMLAAGKTRDEAIEALTPKRANGGRVDRHNIDHAPTEAQKKAGNYAKDHLSFQGLPLTIENAKGSYRGGVGKDGKAWAVCMPCHYGYVKRTEGADGDHVDIFLGPHSKAPNVFVIDQRNAETGKFDEHKAMLGFGSAQQAKAFYHKSFSDGRGPKRLGHMTAMTLAQFKDWVKNYDTTKPLGGNRAN